MADHFSTHVEDWSLQAIVRQSSGEFTKILNDPDSFLDVSGISNHQHLDREFFASFPEIFANTYSDELEGLYKPFYPPCSSHPVQAALDFQEHGVENVLDDKQQIHDQSAGAGFVARANPAYTPKYKKSRKNQHKRVMIKVSAEGLSADMWAWRKYGQKPIKGSPYPRSYYRCSSSKGCLARKQVEQSCTDHGMFIITYTAEHNHSQPTRRNSLAGTVRQKFPTVKQEKPDESMSTDNACSPNTPPQAMDMSMSSLSQGSMNQEQKHEHDFKGDEFVMSDDYVLDDDFFSGLQDFDDFVSEPSLYDHNNSVQAQLPVRSCS